MEGLTIIRDNISDTLTIDGVEYRQEVFRNMRAMLESGRDVTISAKDIGSPESGVISFRVDPVKIHVNS